MNDKIIFSIDSTVTPTYLAELITDPDPKFDFLKINEAHGY